MGSLEPGIIRLLEKSPLFKRETAKVTKLLLLWKVITAQLCKSAWPCITYTDKTPGEAVQVSSVLSL